MAPLWLPLRSFRRLTLVVMAVLLVAPVARAETGLDAEGQVGALLRRLDRYRDGLERSAQRLSLPQALEIGLRDSPALRKAYADIDGADWNRTAIQREWWPTLVVGNDDPGLLGWSTTRTREQVRTSRGWSETLTIEGGQAAVPNITLAWTFYDPTRAPRDAAAAARLRARRLLFKVEVRDQILAIEQSYIALQETYALEQSYRTLYLTIADLVKATDHQRGDDGARDQLITEQLALLIQRIRTHEQVIVAANGLAETLALPPGQLVMPSDPLTVRGQWPTPLQTTIEQALQLREEIQASLALAGSDRWTARARERQRLPILSLEGEVSGSNQASSTASLVGPGRGQRLYGQEIETQVGLGVNWIIFDGGILAAEAAALRSQARRNLAQADLDRLTITRQVQNSHAALINSLVLLEAAEDERRVARQALAAASRDYRNGNGDATRVVQASRALRDATESAVGAIRKHNRAIAALMRYAARWPLTTAADGAGPR